jgi:HK97 family phage major capsid protein
MEELKKKREAAAAELRRLNTLIKTEGRSFTDEERAQWKQADADYSAAAEQIASEERVAQLEVENRGQKVNLSSLGNGNPGENRVVQVDEEQRVLAMQAWFLRNNRNKRPLTEKHIRACEATGIDPHGEELVLRMADTTAANSIRDAWLSGPREQAQARTRAHMRALSSVTAGTGGVLTMPEAIMQALEINLLKHGGILEVCEVMRTEGRERLRWPTANDTSNKGRRRAQPETTTTASTAMAGRIWFCREALDRDRR